MRLALGQRERCIGEFVADHGARYSFDGIVYIGADRWVVMDGETERVDGPAPDPHGPMPCASFRGSLPDGRVLIMERVPLRDYRFDWRGTNNVRVQHARCRVESAESADASGTAEVSISWLLAPSRFVSACSRPIQHRDPEIIDALGADKVKKLDDEGMTLRWTRPDGVELTVGVYERDLDELGDVANMAQGFAARRTYYCPEARVRVPAVEPNRVQGVIEEAESWVADLLHCIALIEKRWVPWRERTTSVRYGGSRRRYQTWEFHGTAESTGPVPGTGPIHWLRPELPAVALGQLLACYRKDRQYVDAAIESWVLASEATSIPSMLVHLFTCAEALKGLYLNRARVQAPLLSKAQRRTVRDDARDAVRRTVLAFGLSASTADMVAKKIRLDGTEKFDHVLQRMVTELNIEVDDLWPAPKVAGKKRFAFIDLRNALVHGRGLDDDEREEQLAEIERLRTFLPRVFEKLFEVPKLVEIMKWVTRAR